LPPGKPGFMFQFLNRPILNLLILLYELLFSNLGLAIVALTLLVGLVLIPLTLPQLKAAQEMQKLAPRLEKLKKKYKDDKQKLMQAQMELYKKNGVNPAAGCLPQILRLVILVSLYQVFNQVIRPGAEVVASISQYLYSFVHLPSQTLNLNFLWLDLSRPDLIQIPGFFPLPGMLVVLAALCQFLSSKLMTPVVKAEEEEAKTTEGKSDDLAVSMQKQMTFLFPLITLVIGYTLPSGVILYWFIFSLFTLVQQLVASGKFSLFSKKAVIFLRNFKERKEEFNSES